MLYEDKTFLTLTYDDENMPHTYDGKQNLDKRDVQAFLKRLRKGYPTKLRYFMVGEYGEKTQRPHYHLALFGYPNCVYGNSQYSKTKNTCCQNCEFIKEKWGKGNVFLGTLERSSAQYIAGYVTKKMTDPNDPRLEGRNPEFATMSLKPGIGADAMKMVAASIQAYGVEDKLDTDVPSELRVGGKKLPVGKYLKSKLRKELDRDEGIPQAEYDKVYQPVREVLETAKNDEEELSPLAHIEKEMVQKIRNAEAREKIYRKRTTL